MTRLLALLFLLVSTPATAGRAAEAPDWADVSAIFVHRCVMCHSDLGAARELRLDTYEGAITGSEKGAVLVPGDKAASELIRRILGESVPRMPFLAPSLPADEIDVILRWVEAGLPETNNDLEQPYRANEASQSP